MIFYSLSEGEEKVANHVSLMREQNNVGIEDRAITNKTSFYNRLNSYGAEIAVCKYLNRYPDMSVHLSSKHYDIILDNGTTIDVKWTYHTNGGLLVERSKKNNPCDIYVLTIGKIPNYSLVGWAYEDEIFKEENIKKLVEHREAPYFLERRAIHKFIPPDIKDKWEKGIRI